MTQRYAHLSDAEVRSAVDKIGQHRRELKECWEGLASKMPLPGHLDKELNSLDAEHAALVARLGGDGRDTRSLARTRTRKAGRSPRGPL